MTDKLTCGNCGKELEENGSREINGETYCEECFDELFAYCEHCEEYHAADDFIEVHNGEYRTSRNLVFVCESCADNDFFRCHSCNEHFPNDARYEAFGDDFCHECFGEYFTSCDNCGETISRDDALYDDYDDGPFCQSCRPNYGWNHSDSIHDYGYKPSPIFWTGKGEKAKRNALHFGFELEIEGGQETAPDLVSEFGKDERLLYCKDDGSLNNGYEIVSHPMTFQFINENREHFNDMLVWLNKKGHSSHKPGTCGLHIHMSKAAFSSSFHLYKFANFVYSEQMLDFNKKISRRKRFGFCQIDGLGKKEIVQKATRPYDHANHYDALNLSPSKTAELRFFRGTLNPESFFAALEYCQAVFEYTRDNSPKSASPEKFLNWLNTRNEFACLRAYIVRMKADLGICKPVVKNLPPVELEKQLESQEAFKAPKELQPYLFAEVRQLLETLNNLHNSN